MLGQRIEYDGAGIPESGAYWLDPRDGNWYAMTPNGHLAGLANHNVVEHEDGTITVAPSIKVSGIAYGQDIRVTDGEERVFWHGYLEHGVWRSC